MTNLSEKVALVTGASRGVGRGIAHELGLAGATVYVTGRSRDGEPTTDGLPGTIDDTARLVDAAGGRGIAVPCDHRSQQDTEAVARRIAEEQGRLDLLVNNVWGGYENYDGSLFTAPLWEQPIWRWDKMMTTGVRAHYLTTRATARLLVAAAPSLVVNVSFGDRDRFLGDVQYDVAKYAVSRLGFALGEALAPEGVTALTVFPGFTRTERVTGGASEEDLEGTHSPRFVGRAVVALASDDRVGDKRGKTFKVGDLARTYGFRDIDGSCPEPFRLPD